MMMEATATPRRCSVDSSDGADCDDVDDHTNRFRVLEKLYRYRPSAAPSICLDQNTAPLSKTQQKRLKHQQRRREKDEAVLFQHVIDVHDVNNSLPHNSARVKEVEHNIFTIDGCDGLFIVKNALREEEQLFWAHQALSRYSHAEHTNLTNLFGPQPDHWSAVLQRDDWSGIKQLRWSSLGYHYNWTLRSYQQDNHSLFPQQLASLAAHMASLVGYSLHPEAAICNYYPLHGSMGAHVDNAELTELPPIVSISLGQSAIFLLGTPSRKDTPTALWLHSGDVLIMGGEARQCFHAVPRIVHTRDFTPITRSQDPDSLLFSIPLDELSHVCTFLSSARININIRQVEDEQHTFQNTVPRSQLCHSQMSMRMTVSDGG